MISSALRMLPARIDAARETTDSAAHSAHAGRPRGACVGFQAEERSGDRISRCGMRAVRGISEARHRRSRGSCAQGALWRCFFLWSCRLRGFPICYRRTLSSARTYPAARRAGSSATPHSQTVRIAEACSLPIATVNSSRSGYPATTSFRHSRRLRSGSTMPPWPVMAVASPSGPPADRPGLGAARSKKEGAQSGPLFALPPEFRFRRGETGPPRDEETAASWDARPGPASQFSGCYVETLVGTRLSSLQ